MKKILIEATSEICFEGETHPVGYGPLTYSDPETKFKPGEKFVVELSSNYSARLYIFVEGKLVSRRDISLINFAVAILSKDCMRILDTDYKGD